MKPINCNLLTSRDRSGNIRDHERDLSLRSRQAWKPGNPQLIKDENANNKLINKIPDTPERTDLPASYIERYSQEELEQYNKVYNR